jgi:D-alanyl-D-alanine carboxypeptidase/D-alanyl-D-alanine-endopeptidase (penicillin-binding protein 4)
MRALPYLAFALLLSLGFVPANAAPPDDLTKGIEEITNRPEYKHASWGILVVNGKTGETVYSRNPDSLLMPASVTKLFSCATALVALGADHKTETVVYQRGITIKGNLRGDLVLLAGGDLSLGGRTKEGKTVFKDKDHTYANSGLGDSELTDTDPLAGLNELAKQVKAAGITQVEGEVLIDDRLFVRTRSTGSGPEAVTPIMVNDNAVDLTIKPSAKEGEPAKVVMRPETSFFTLDASVTTGPADTATTLQLLPVSPTQFAVRGKVPAGGKPLVRIYAVDEPVFFARTLFIEALRRNGVRVQASLLRPAHNNLPAKSDYEKLAKVGTFTSAPLKDTLTVTLKVSHNLYASSLPCLVAVAKGQTTAEAGLKEQRRILKELGVDTNAVSFGGGAGGSPADFVSPRATVQLLQGMSKHADWEVYKAALPVLGVDGTLAETVKADSPARGKVFAKTGTYSWYDAVNDRYLLKSKALAGTMTTKAGTPLFFCMFVNNVPLTTGMTATTVGKTLGHICEVLYERGP